MSAKAHTKFYTGPKRHINFNELEWQIPVEEFPKTRLTVASEKDAGLFAKKITDKIISAIALVCLVPLFTFIGIIIKLGTKGPIFFKQERVGIHGKKFKIYKFRTMFLNAEFEKKNLILLNEASGPVFKIENDPRITKFGKLLRKTGLDELPQLINVLKGEMSLIGPRPPLEEEVKQYEPHQTHRLSVKPGITCTWQIVPNRHAVSFEDWAAMDLKYIDDWTFKEDVSIFFKTIKTFFVAGGH